MLTADQLSKYYGQRHALDGVSFRIETGEVIGFVGPNGAGKTTVLKILSGALAASSGRILLNGVDDDATPETLRARVGFLPDRPPLYNEMTVTAMLTFAARLNGYPNDRVEPRVSEVLAICQLEAVQNDLVAWLSHGYRQRLGIAQAIVHEPQLLILDEPTSGLDPRQIVEVRNLLRALARQHTILVSSHILAELEQCCDRFLFLHHGRIIAQGDAAQLRRQLPLGQFQVIGHGVPEHAVRVARGCPGISDVRLADADAGHYAFTARAYSEDSRESLVAALVAQGFGVGTVANLDGNQLESVFLQLTADSQA